jgi:LuxR family maltose regulon positive regulatory protein
MARDALALLPEHDPLARGWATLVLGLAVYRGGDLDSAHQILSEAVAIGERSGHSHVAVLALCNLAALQMDRGKLRAADDCLLEALRFSGEYADRTARRLPGSALAHTYQGILLCQWNHLDTALGHLREGVQLARWRGEPLRLSAAYLHLAAGLQQAGETNAALKAVNEARQASVKAASPWSAARVDRVEAWVRFRQGDIAAASRWADSHRREPDDFVDRFDHWTGCLLRARIDIVRGRMDSVVELLMHVSESAQAAGGTHYVIASQVLQAVALQAQGLFDQALTALELALSLAEPQGYVRIFIDEGEPVARLLREAAGRGIAVDYVGQLLKAWAEERARRGQQAQPSHSDKLVEPLSDRELQVLRLLAAGLTNREIGDQLYLAVGTVKKYTSTIYGKLGARSRTQAVAKGRDLGLL